MSNEKNNDYTVNLNSVNVLIETKSTTNENQLERLQKLNNWQRKDS